MKRYFFTVISLLLLGVGSVAAQTAPATNYKGINNSNPISPCVFCADPTALEYKGRLYVYGTNDHQQFIANNKSGSNGYGSIKSLVVFSTTDMVNWTFHGTIDVGKVCGSWCGQSWAPSATWRTNNSGKDEFFIYFANGGGSVGVIKGDTPLGPFRSPNTQAMIRHGMPGVDPCNWVFDPGVVIDDNGQGWIAFGGGDPQPTGSNLMPGNSRIAKLKPSMTAIDGAAVNLPAPFLFEASELNMMNGRYVYTYNTSWGNHPEWSSYPKRNGQPAPSSCSMCYMVTDNPMDPDSWEYRGEYVPNEGNFDMGWGNNHTHLQKFQGEYYLFYHSTYLESLMKTGASGFRSIGVDKATVDESTQSIKKMTLTKTGVQAIANLNPYEEQQAETMSTCGGISYENFINISKNTSINTLGNDASRNLLIKIAAGAWTMLRKVDFGSEGATSFRLRAKGTGTLEIRFGSKAAKSSAILEFSSTAFTDHTVTLDPAVFKDVKSVYFVFTSSNNVMIDAWQFYNAETEGIEQPRVTPAATTVEARYDLGGRRLSDDFHHRGLVIEQYKGSDGLIHFRKRTNYDELTS